MVLARLSNLLIVNPVGHEICVVPQRNELIEAVDDGLEVGARSTLFNSRRKAIESAGRRVPDLSQSPKRTCC